MRIRLILLSSILIAISAAGQAPVRTVIHYPSVPPPAEIFFVDGNVSSYTIKRISKDLIRVDPGNDQSFRMPLTYVDSIRFVDGCTLHFDQGVFQFDKLVQPARLRNESGDVLLEGVLPLTRSQTESLMGPDYYGAYRRQSRLFKAGEITLFTGAAMLIPYLGNTIFYMSRGVHPASVQCFKDMNPVWKGITVGGCGVLIAGAVLTFIGNNNCNRVVATYNDGLGVAYTF